MINRKIIFILLLLFAFSGKMKSQTNYSATIGTAIACSGDTLLVPIDVINFNNIGAITLYITYDTAVLQFDTIVNVNSQIPGALGNGIIYPEPKVGIAWFSMSTNPANIGSGKLLDLMFYYKGGNDTLSFNAACEVADINVNILPVSFINGAVVTGSVPVIASHPTDTTVFVGSSTSFNVQASGAVSYQWQLSIDSGLIWNDLTNTAIYSNVTDDTIIIGNTTSNMDGYWFRCNISSQCNIISGHANLTIDTSVGLNQNEKPSGISIHNYPDPAIDYTTIEYKIKNDGWVVINLFNLNGEIINELANSFHFMGKHKIDFDTSGIAPGIYLYKMCFNSKGKHYYMIDKMIIIK